ncbi:MAG: sodium:solute symporter family protein [Pyrodictiaceae archaeon]
MAQRLLLGLLVLVAYVAGGSILAYIARRAGLGRAVDYYVGGYRLGGLLAALTYAATTYSAFMIVGLVGLSYVTGVPSLGFELSYFVATLLLLAALGPRAWSLARRYGWISPAEMLGKLYDSRLIAMLVAILYMVSLLPYVAAQVKGVAEAIAGLSGGQGYFYGVLLALGVILLWTLLAGLWSVAVTDALQGFWMIASASLLLLWLFVWGYVGHAVSLNTAIQRLASKGLLGASAWSPIVFVAYTIPWVFFAATNPQVVQRLYMPRDKKAYKVMVAGFALFGFIFTAIVTMIGLLARGLTELGILPNLAAQGRDAVTPSLLSLADPITSSIVFTSIVAAAVSTADSIILSVASSWSIDLYKQLRRQASDRELLLFGKVIIVVTALLASLIALARIGFIVELSVLSSLLLLPLAPVTIIAWIIPERVRGSGKYALASIIVGELVAVVAYLLAGSPRGALVYTVLGLPAPAWTLIASLIVLAPLFARRSA